MFPFKKYRKKERKVQHKQSNQSSHFLTNLLIFSSSFPFILNSLRVSEFETFIINLKRKKKNVLLNVKNIPVCPNQPCILTCVSVLRV